MFGVLLALFVSLAVCELPPAGYRFPLLDAPAAYSGLAGDATFQRVNGDLVTFTKIDGMPVVAMVSHPALAVDIAPRSFSQTVQNSYLNDPLLLAAIDKQGVQAAFVNSVGYLYVFSGSAVWSFTDSLTISPTLRPARWVIRENYPRLISLEFEGAPDAPDAVFELPNGHIYFLKGTQFWLYKDTFLYPQDGHVPIAPCYPKDITQEFELPDGAAVLDGFYSPTTRSISLRATVAGALVTLNFADKYVQHHFKDTLQAPQANDANVLFCTSGDPVVTDPVPTTYDAIFQRKTGKIYIFKDTQYWRLTDKDFVTNSTADCLDDTYPQLIADSFQSGGAGALPGNVDAVFQRSNGKIYFFIGTQYYRFTDKYLDPEGDPSLPDSLDTGYPKDLLEFGILASQYANKKVVSAFQRPNGKIFIFLSDLTTGAITYFRITDKYIVGGSDDIVDPAWAASTDGLPLDYGFVNAPETDEVTAATTLTNVYQRVESNQLIYFIDGANYRPVSDKYLRIPSLCTACNPSNQGQ